MWRFFLWNLAYHVRQRSLGFVAEWQNVQADACFCTFLCYDESPNPMTANVTTFHVRYVGSLSRIRLAEAVYHLEDLPDAEELLGLFYPLVGYERVRPAVMVSFDMGETPLELTWLNEICCSILWTACTFGYVFVHDKSVDVLHCGLVALVIPVV